jgi:hypothetical protein
LLTTQPHISHALPNHYRRQKVPSEERRSISLR